MKKTKLIKRNDMIIVISVIIISLIILAFSTPGGNAVAEVYKDGSLIYSEELGKIKQKENIALGNGVVIHTDKNGICFLESDCTTKECVRCGMLSSPGDTAVCIPNRTVIKITGSRGNSTDAVSY